MHDVRLGDGRDLRLRPTRTSDTRAMQDLFYRLSDDDRETRFLHKLSSLTDSAAQHLCSVDYEEEMAFAAVVGPAADERIVAASCYYLNPATGLAEVAYRVDPDWQGLGLGGILHAELVEYARDHGARGLTADVLLGNTRMMRVFERGDHSLSVKTAGGVEELTMPFRARASRRPGRAPGRSAAGRCGALRSAGRCCRPGCPTSASRPPA